MEYRALGAVTVVRDGEFVDVGPSRQRAVLSLLLIHRNEVLTTDRILEEIWGAGGDGKLNALRVHISRLRSALDPDHRRGASSVLETVGAGYRLNVDAERFDVDAFEAGAERGRVLCEGDPEGAHAELVGALDRWRGSPYEDFEYDEFVQAERRRLLDARTDAIELRIGIDLRCGRAGSVLSELEVLREQFPYRERLVEHQARALYLSGRSTDALRSIDRHRRFVGEELGVEPSPAVLRLEEQILVHDERIQPRGVDGVSVTTASTNPYQGLRAFGTDDAARYFGRDASVAEILRSIRGGQRLVAVVGASGSGKSSLVRAGVVPALRKGAIEGSDRWVIASMVPGAHPFVELAGALGRATVEFAPERSAGTVDDDRWLLRTALRVLPDESSRLVVVIDQFEELFTLVGDADVREAFLSNLVTALDDAHRRILVVLALRADFYTQPLEHPGFGARLGEGIINVTALTSEELGVAARLPAEQVGVTLEPALVGQLIGDVGTRPASLPLFQFALTELYDRRVGAVLTVASYRSMGGLDGALSRRADALLDELDAEQRAVARQLFLRLVLVRDDGVCVRRRTVAREIVSLDVDPATLEQVIDMFGRHRLLSFDSDQLTGAPTVEVAHESLLVAWPTMERWVDESRDDLRRHVSLATAVREWQLADRDPAFLWAGPRLADLDGLLATSELHLNGSEREFVASSRAEVERVQAEDDRRERSGRRARRLLAATAGALAATLAVIGAVVFGLFDDNGSPVVAYVGDRGNGSWHAATSAGLERSSDQLGFELVDVPFAIDPIDQLRAYAAGGPTVVVTDTFTLLQDPTVIADFPDVRFGAIGELEIDGLTTIGLAGEEGGYLAGVAAASQSRTGVVGFIGGAHIPEIEAFQAGLEAGAASIDPDVSVVAVYVNQTPNYPLYGFSNPDVARRRADSLFDRDVDVVFVAAGPSADGVFDVLDDRSDELGRHLWGIGLDAYGASEAGGPHHLTSIVTNGEVGANRLVEHLLGSAEHASLTARPGVADGAVRLTQGGDNLSQQLTRRLANVERDLANGMIDIPTTSDNQMLIGARGEEVFSIDDVPNLLSDEIVPDASGAAASGRTPKPDRLGATPGDDGDDPLPLGTITSLPDWSRVDFLLTHCPPGFDGCYRDYTWIHPPDVPHTPEPSLAGRPFYVRHGFPNEGAEPLGPGFDVVLYAMPMVDLASDSGGEQIGPTRRYTSDYVIRGTTDGCGPTYRSQNEPVSCEWFVHEFPDGLPYGRWALWADWEGPCHAWIDIGFLEQCADPHAVISLFSSGGDNPFT